MICVIALVVFGILGIFSATHRQYFKEALSCVGRRVTLRPCNTNFDQVMKSKIVAKVMKRSPKLASFTHKNFEVISWVFMILMFVSMGYSAYSLYNLAVHGTCDINHPEQCVFGGTDKTSEVCPDTCKGENCPKASLDACGIGCDCNDPSCAYRKLSSSASW